MIYITCLRDNLLFGLLVFYHHPNLTVFDYMNDLCHRFSTFGSLRFDSLRIFRSEIEVAYKSLRFDSVHFDGNTTTQAFQVHSGFPGPADAHDLFLTRNLRMPKE